jgi:uncharacterized membrane protein YgcG
MSDHKAYSLEQAREFFLNHHTGSVTCIEGDRRKLCRSYPEAVAFFQEHRGSGTPTGSTRAVSGSSSPQPDPAFGWTSQIVTQDEPASSPTGGSTPSRDDDNTPSYTGGGSDTGYTGGGGDTGGGGASGDW